MHNIKNNKGFTLVELSIVIVNIAILSAGALGVTTSIHNAKLRNIISEAQDYESAYELFVERFKQMPGDFSDGAKYWGNDCEGSTGGSDLCSGEGDRKIDHGSNDALANTSETFVAWKHFEKAELVKESYTGLEGTGSNCSGSDQCATVGENIPKTTWKNNVGYYIITGTSMTAIFLGGELANGWNYNSHMEPKDSRSIDEKIDDADPVNGTFRASSIPGHTLLNGGSCIDGGTTYNLDNTSDVCGAIFIVDGL